VKGHKHLSGTPAALAAVALDWLEAVHAHAREAYPEECCGILIRSREGKLRAARCGNLQNRLHEREPQRHPRSARTGYFLDPADYLHIERECEGSGDAIAAIYHSHTDTGAYFSDLDRRQAAPMGEPVLPGVSYLVVSVIAAQVREATLYAWDHELKEYVDVELVALGG
jgi:proteasome lid subunit RPN8/RPN11